MPPSRPELRLTTAPVRLPVRRPVSENVPELELLPLTGHGPRPGPRNRLLYVRQQMLLLRAYPPVTKSMLGNGAGRRQHMRRLLRPRAAAQQHGARGLLPMLSGHVPRLLKPS